MFSFMISFLIFLALSGLAYGQIKCSLQKKMKFMSKQLTVLERERRDLQEERDKFSHENDKLLAEVEQLKSRNSEMSWLLPRIRPGGRKLELLDYIQERGFASPDQIEKVRGAVSESRSEKTLEEELVMRGVVDSRQLKEARTVVRSFNSMGRR